MLPLETTASAAVGLTMIAAGHPRGWPILRGGAQSLTDAMVRHLGDLGGRVETGREVTELPLSDLVLADITPRQLLRIAGSHLSTDYRKQLVGPEIAQQPLVREEKHFSWYSTL